MPQRYDCGAVVCRRPSRQGLRRRDYLGGSPSREACNKREELIVKLNALKEIIAGWNKLLEVPVEVDEESRKSPPQSPVPASQKNSPTRASTRARQIAKRTHEDDNQDNETSGKYPRTAM